MTELALLYALLSTGERITEYVPAWYCETIVEEKLTGSFVEMVAMDGSIHPVSRAACFAMPAVIGDCEMEPAK